MKKILFFVLLSTNLFAEEAWITIKKEEIDLNNDGKKDEISWMTKSKVKDARPQRLLIMINGVSALDYTNDFCTPGQEYRNPEGCFALILNNKLSSKNQAILTLRSENSASSVDQSSETYTYRWQDNSFQLIGATYESHMTGQVEERENESFDINYSTGNAIHQSWVEIGQDNKIKDKTSEKCNLKNKRKGEKLSAFSAFPIQSEMDCKRKLVTAP